MKTAKIAVLITSLILIVSLLAGCVLTENEPEQDAPSESTSAALNENENTTLDFRPVDIGIQAQKEYIYPFIGIYFAPTDSLYAKIDNREAFVYQAEEFEDAVTVKYAFITFYATTAEQRAETVRAIDIYAFLSRLEKAGVIGIYDKSSVGEIDTLTGCDSHKKVGESIDGNYEYYLSINSSSSSDIVTELEKSQLFITEMREFDASYSYSAFSLGKDENVNNVGVFTGKDVFGNAYTQDIFSEYDLTLVNVMTTWCTYCVEEMPELEELRANYVKDGVKFNVVAVVLDTKYTGGEDASAIELAKTLHKRSGASFPFLIPDDGNMNGRLTGIESFPESFFVDKNGNIVSEAYIGARGLKEWKAIADSELKKLEEANR